MKRIQYSLFATYSFYVFFLVAESLSGLVTYFITKLHLSMTVMLIYAPMPPHNEMQLATRHFTLEQ
jgi:hypothetical protein